MERAMVQRGMMLAMMPPLLLLLCATYYGVFSLASWAPGLLQARWTHTVDDETGGSSVQLNTGYLEENGGTAENSHLQFHGRALNGRRKRRSVFRPDRPSDYVSIGRVRPFTGDVNPSAALRSALEARSFKREVILITDTRPRFAMQLYDNMGQLGLAHTLWLTTSQTICNAADKLLAARADLRRQRPSDEQSSGVSTKLGVEAGASGRRAMQTTESERRLNLFGAEAPVVVSVSTAMTALAAANIAAASGRRTSIRRVTGSESLAASAADVACIWYDHSFPDVFVEHRRLMMKRIMLLLRAVRLGFNVLSMDTDVMVFREPYSFLKHPPYSLVNMLVGKTVRGGCIVNTGVMYFQNISRTGPVAWLLTNVVERNMQWLQPGVMNASQNSSGTGPMFLSPPEPGKRGCWDQLLFGDALLTSITGKLSLYYCVRPPERSLNGSERTEEPGARWNARHRTALGLLDRQGPADLLARLTTSVTDPELLSIVASDSFVTSWAKLTIPKNPPPLLPDEPGYSLPPRQPGDLVELFQLVLKQDDELEVRMTLQGRGATSRRLRAATAAARGNDRCEPTSSLADCVAVAGRLLGRDTAPWDRDVVREGCRLLQHSSRVSGSSGVQAPQEPPHPPRHRDVEVMAYAADWLVGGWGQRGALGYWDPTLTNGAPRQVFGHLVRAPGPTGIGKEAVRMQYNEYDWELAALTDGGPFPFLGSANASEVPRVVALLPGVDVTTNTPVQWSNLARGLAQIALLTGRRVVWPAIPCASKWVQPNPGSRRALPLNPNPRFLAHGSFSTGLVCTSAATLHPKCLFERVAVPGNDTTAPKDGVLDVARREGPRGLLPVEFEMLLHVLPPEVGQPGPHNTVQLQSNDDYDDGNGGERPVMFDEPPRTQGITYVKASAVAQSLRSHPLAAQPVLYLAQRTFLTQLDKLKDADLMARYRAFRNECPALK